MYYVPRRKANALLARFAVLGSRALQSSLSFSAVLLAGGRSSRMGRDKALLPLAGGQLLWERQLSILQALGPAELLISGPERAGFAATARVIADRKPGLGPLAGIAAALVAATHPLVVVLAVDLPGMTTEYLGQLLRASLPARGTVPENQGFYEPLAAVYPRASAEIAARRLAGPDRSLQQFVRAAISAGQLTAHPILPPERHLFTNWNYPPGE